MCDKFTYQAAWKFINELKDFCISNKISNLNLTELFFIDRIN